jgi:hypothetical protein
MGNPKGMSDQNYKVNITKEDLIKIYTKQWVLEWCKKFHPEAFEEAEEFVRKHFEKVKEVEDKK